MTGHRQEAKDGDFMFDAVALGEVLIDFTPNGVSENGNVLFERNPGGAPANVLAMLARLGRRTAFIGKVGSDDFGLFLRDTLRSSGIETGGLVFSKEVNTTLAFVHLHPDGDRSFSFYRKPGADLMLAEDEVDVSLIGQSRLFHFGSVSLTGEPSRSATFAAAKYAKEHGVLVSYDPNLREKLWDSLDEAKAVMLEGMSYADVLKVSEEELHFLTDGLDLAEGTSWIGDRYGIRFIFVTQGSQGCYYRIGGDTGQVPGYRVTAVDATGAGDAFFGAALYKLLECSDKLRQLTKADMEQFVRFANAAGALTATKKGAIPSLPDRARIEAFMTE